MNLKHTSSIITLAMLLSSSLITCAHDPSADIYRLFNKSALGRIADYCAQSWVVERWNDWKAQNRPLDSRETSLASEHLQQMGRKAQDAVGIKKQKQVTIINHNSIRDFWADYKHILLNEQMVRAAYLSPHEPNEYNKNKALSSYGVLNCNLHHESVHIKYNDRAFNSFIGTAGTILSLTLTPALIKTTINPQGLLKLIYPVAMLLTAGSGVFLAVSHITYHYERRADTEGHYATQCHVCVSEKAEEVRMVVTTCDNAFNQLQEELKNINPNESPENALRYQEITNGLTYIRRTLGDKSLYLSAEENELIAARLKKENKVCDYHRVTAIEPAQSAQQSSL